MWKLGFLTLDLLFSVPSSFLSTPPAIFATGFEDVLGRLADAMLVAPNLLELPVYKQ